MRTLIDGYNLMYALGLLGQRFGPDGFRKVRHRFLNDLAAALGPIEAAQTTVVFDAANPPAEFPRQASHKGITVIFAVDDESADAQIECLIAQHSAPKTLTVVSSDHRIRQAATRRKARALPAEEFWTHLEARKRHQPAEPEPPGREQKLSPQESDYWLHEFRDLVDAPEIQEALRSDPGMLTDAEIADLEREIERETGF